MRVRVNGKEREVPAGTTVAALLDQMGVRGPSAVEINREVVRRDAHATTELREGDVVEVVQFVGGG